MVATTRITPCPQSGSDRRLLLLLLLTCCCSPKPPDGTRPQKAKEKNKDRNKRRKKKKKKILYSRFPLLVAKREGPSPSRTAQIQLPSSLLFRRFDVWSCTSNLKASDSLLISPGHYKFSSALSFRSLYCDLSTSTRLSNLSLFVYVNAMLLHREGCVIPIPEIQGGWISKEQDKTSLLCFPIPYPFFFFFALLVGRCDLNV